MNFYKHYIGDFQRDTGHLSLTERGAYLCLIHHYYATERPLPNDMDALCRIAGAVTKVERAAVKVVTNFFEQVDSGLMHARIEAELEKAGEISNTNRAIALAREEKRRTENAARLEHEQSTLRAQSVARLEHEQSTNQTPDSKPIARLTPSLSESQKTVIHDPLNESEKIDTVPPCPQKQILDSFARNLPMLTQPRLWEGSREQLLRNRWRALAKPNGVTRGYSSQADGIAFFDRFFAYVAKSTTLTEGIPRKDGGAWLPDLPWLLKAENFAKVVEGRFHDEVAA